MKFVKWILRIILPVLLLLVTMSFALEDILVATVKETISTQNITEYVTDYVEEEIPTEKVNEIADKIKESKYVDEMTRKYIDYFTENLEDYKKDMPNIVNDVKNIIENEFSEYFTEEQKEKIYKTVEEKVESIDSIPTYDNSSFQPILKVYGVFTKQSFRITICVILALDIILLIILRKIDVLKDIGISSIVTSVISFLVFIVIKLIAFAIEQSYENIKINDSNFSLLKYLILFEIIIGIVTLVTRAVTKKLRKDK